METFKHYIHIQNNASGWRDIEIMSKKLGKCEKLEEVAEALGGVRPDEELVMLTLMKRGYILVGIESWEIHKAPRM